MWVLVSLIVVINLWIILGEYQTLKAGVLPGSDVSSALLALIVLSVYRTTTENRCK